MIHCRDLHHNMFLRILSFLQIPGRPILQEVNSDSVRITWTTPRVKVDCFQVCYKERKKKSPLKISETKAEENYATIKGLLENTEYTFQIRGVFGNQEVSYGPVNNTIKTKKSLGTTLLGHCTLQDDSQKPYKYKLPAIENKGARNENARIRQFILGWMILFLFFLQICLWRFRFTFKTSLLKMYNTHFASIIRRL